MTKPTSQSPAPTKGIRKSLLFSSSILTGVLTLGTFTSAVEAQEIDLDHDFLQDLYEQYTALNVSTEVTSEPSNENLEDTEIVNDELPEELAEELDYIKSQLLKMIELAGGESVLEQLDSEHISVEQLDTIFNALIEQQLNNEDAVESADLLPVDETEDTLEDEVVEANLTNLDNDSSEIEETVKAEKVVLAVEQTESESEPDNTLEDPEEGIEEVIVEAPEEEPAAETPEEEAKIEAPKEETKVETPEEEPKTEAPKEEKPKTETPKEQPKTEASKVEKPKTEAPKEQPGKADVKPLIYVVKSGDTLGKIAQQYYTTAAKLASLNNISNINRISVGQVLAVNEAGVQEAKAPQPTTPGNLNQATTPTAFINQIAGYAQEVAAQNGLYASVMIAQASLESGYGRSSLSAHPNYNLFGIKGSYNGQSVAKQTKEYYSHTGWITITDHFKKYPDYEASLNDNARLLRRGLSWNPEFYAGAWIERTTSYRDATAWLQGRYATDPTYASKLNNLIQLYDLTRFDVPAGSVSKPTPSPAPTPSPSPANPSDPFKETAKYTVARGDTLSKIAREFKTTVQALKAANHLSTDLIFVNQTLTVPKLVSAQPAPEQPKEETKPDASTPKPSNPVEAGNQSYTVVNGDNLSKIARQFGTTVSAIRQANNLSGDLIFINQKLSIPSSGSVEKPSTPIVEDTGTKTQTITVKSGDTLSQLARTYKTTVAVLKESNNLDSDRIFVGQKLTVKGSADSVGTPPVDEKTNETASGTTNYTVKNGDTLYRLARTFNTSVSQLRSLNNLKSDMIRTGATITVPSDKPVEEQQKPVNSDPVETAVYTVKSGDTLSQIARDYKTTVTKLQTDNNLSNDRIFIGQKLTVNGTTVIPEKPADTKLPAVQVDYVVKSGDTLSQIARTHNTTVNELSTLNNLKDTNRLTVGQKLIVTKGQVEQVKPEPSKPAPAPANGSYTVKSGDTLSQIARTHNMTLNQLRDLNNLENADRIFIGQSIVVAAATVNTPKPVSPAPVPEPVKPANGSYTVKSGDTLSQIARTYNMSLAQLMELNKLDNADRLSIGQRLVVSTEIVDTPKPVTPAPAPEPVKPANGSYTVKSGDTLSQIARTYNMSLAQLMELNKLENADRLSIGQRLVVLTEIVDVPKPVTPAPVPEPVKTGQVDYTVKSGDTLSQIAKEYKVSLSQIKEWNNLASDIIFINQKLVIRQVSVTEPVSNLTESAHTVSAGDTLSHIARLYNVTINELKEMNDLTSDLIFVNQTLTVSK